MNGKKRSDKDLLHLGLPPMELAESIPKLKPEVSVQDNSGLKKFIYSTLPKLIAILILLFITLGSFIILLTTLQNIDYNHKTEVIVVTRIFDTSNKTTGQNDVEIIMKLLNDTSHSTTNREKRQVLSPSDSPNSDEKETIEKFNEETYQKAKDVILNNDVMCNNENKNEICKQIVTKLKSITESNADTNPDKEHEGITKNAIKTKYAEASKVTNKIKHEEDVILTSTDKTKQETSPKFPNNMFKSTPNVLFEGKTSGLYPHDNEPNVFSYPQQVPSPLSETCLLARLLKENYPTIQDVYSEPASGYLPPSYENHPLPYSGYVPPVIPSPYLHGRDAEHRKRPVHPQDADIFMKFLTQAHDHPKSPVPVCNSTHRDEGCSRAASCPEGTLACNSGECISEGQWCDRTVDCSDSSDETSCSCKSRVDKSRVCDGYFDCPFGEDEMGCYGCGDFVFSCGDVDMNSQSTCFTKEQRCNNFADCPNQRDEIECNMLSPTLHKKPLFAVSNTEGFLHRNFKGNWYPVCTNPYMWAHDACRRETGLILRPPFIQLVPVDPMLKVNYLNTGPGGLVHTSTSCFNSSAVYVTCPDLLCGTRVLSTSQLLRENAAVENHLFGRNKRFLLKSHPYPLMFYRHRTRRYIANTADKNSNRKVILSNVNKTSKFDEKRNKRAESRVVGGKPSDPTSWPWMIAMYRDGMFHCGGVVLTQRWVMSAAHCVQNFWEHYYEIQVGMLRRFSFSPQEHNHHVTHIIVNHHYSQTDMKNDMSLLRVKPSIIFNRWVRPICLPGPETAGTDWMWGPAAGTLCTAVGWGATVEHGPDPDHLREVELPVWAKCKHSEDQAGKEICAGPVEGGRDACQGDSGGPLLCRNPLNSQQWYMAGIVSHGDGCARENEPGVYTRVSLFVKWIKFNIFSKTLPTIQPKQECPGFKCVSGISKCIPKKRMCDKIVDCLDADDERNCDSMRSTFTLGENNLFLTTSSKEDSVNIDQKTKEADVGDNLTANLEGSSTVVVSTTNNPVTNSEYHKTREAGVPPLITTSNLITETTEMHEPNDLNQNSDTNNSLSKDSLLQNESDMITASSSLDNVIKPEVNYSHASTLEILHSKSSEDSTISNNSEEQVTVDPNKSAVSEEMDRTSRGDMQFTIISSRESLESRSVILEEKKSKEADIHEDWTDSESTLSDSLVSKHSNGRNETPGNSNKQNQHFETTTASQNSEGTTLDTTLETKESFHLSTLIDNANTKPESKDLIVDLHPNSQTTSSSHANENVSEQTENAEQQEIFDTSDTNSNISPAKNLQDAEGKNDIINKLKDIVFTNLQPAKIRKKHIIPKEFECRRIYQIILYHHRCDHKADCEDGTDELGCTCTDYLLTFDKNLLCDGIFDCADGQDEIECYNCPEDQFLCHRSQLCLPSKYVCDGKPQCPQGEDELDCFALSNGKNIVYDLDSRPKISLEGYLTKKHTKDWHIVCEDNLSTDQQEQTATHICRYLGFSSANRYLVKYINVKEGEILKAKEDVKRNRRDINEVPVHFAYREVEENTARHIIIKEPQVLKEQCVPNVTKTCMSLYVYCDHSLFNELDVAPEILYSREAEDTTHMWPWVAKVNVAGEYKCTGVLLDRSWVVVSHSCLWDSLINHHITVVLGSHKTISSVHGMYEQIYQVDVKKDLYHSKVTLLHLKEPAHYSNMVKPMVLPAVSNLHETKPTICVANGQNEKNVTVGVFLQETNDNCDLNSRCFVRLRPNENICEPGSTFRRQWSGIISCHSNQGWYPAASFVDNGGECGFGNRIQGSEIGNLKNEMKNYTGRTVSNSTEEAINDVCYGQRCGRGQCISLTQVCDGVNHCHDGKDESETACIKKEHICLKNPYHRGCECSSGQMKCHNGRCVAKELFGDGHDDCGDGTDEPGYRSCSNYISRVKPSRLCDGILHCQDRSDEDPMFCKCFAKRTYKCHGTSDEIEHCVAPDMVCDGVKDCPNGDDERTCIALSSPEGSTKYGTGQVIARSNGVWLSKCYPTQNHTKSELEAICRGLGFISGHAKQLYPPGNKVYYPYNNLVVDPFSDVVLNNNTKLRLRSSDEPIAKALVNEALENCHPLFIECI